MVCCRVDKKCLLESEAAVLSRDPFGNIGRSLLVPTIGVLLIDSIVMLLSVFAALDESLNERLKLASSVSRVKGMRGGLSHVSKFACTKVNKNIPILPYPAYDEQGNGLLRRGNSAEMQRSAHP